jgi:type I restriction enzyme M protein
MKEFIELQKGRKDSPKSWTIKVKDLDKKTGDLAVKNPNKGDEVIIRSPIEILDEIEAADEKCRQLIDQIRGLL